MSFTSIDTHSYEGTCMKRIATWFFNQTITTKVLIAFVVISLLVVGAGFIGYHATANMSKNAEKMYDEQFIPLSLISRITESYQRTRIYAQNFIPEYIA